MLSLVVPLSSGFFLKIKLRWPGKLRTGDLTMTTTTAGFTLETLARKDSLRSCRVNAADVRHECEGGVCHPAPRRPAGDGEGEGE
jgi:hypothetical protein